MEQIGTESLVLFINIRPQCTHRVPFADLFHGLGGLSPKTLSRVLLPDQARIVWQS